MIEENVFVINYFAEVFNFDVHNSYPHAYVPSVDDDQWDEFRLLCDSIMDKALLTISNTCTHRTYIVS